MYVCVCVCMSIVFEGLPLSLAGIHSTLVSPTPIYLHTHAYRLSRADSNGPNMVDARK